MKKLYVWALRLSGPSLVLLSVGCSSADERDNDAADSSDDIATYRGELNSPRFFWRHRHTASNETGGSASTETGGATSGGAVGTAGTPSTSSGGTSSTTPTATAGCEICTKANACCETASGGALCSYDARACAALEPVAQAAYINSCRTLLDTVKKARESSRAAAPTSCY